MDTNALSTEIFIKNIEDRFENEYNNLPIFKRIFSINDNDVSNHSARVGITLFGCVKEFNKLFLEYAQNIERNNLETFNQSVYNYIKYINLKVECFDFLKIDENKQIFEVFFKNIFYMIFISWLDLKNYDLYTNILKNILKNSINEIKNEDNINEINESILNIQKIIFKEMFKTYDLMILELLNKHKNDKENSLFKILFRFYDLTLLMIFNFLEIDYDKFNKMIIKNTIINVFADNDKLFRLILIKSLNSKKTLKQMKNKYYNEKQYSKYIIFKNYLKYLK